MNLFSKHVYVVFVSVLLFSLSSFANRADFCFRADLVSTKNPNHLIASSLCSVNQTLTWEDSTAYFQCQTFLGEIKEFKLSKVGLSHIFNGHSWATYTVKNSQFFKNFYSLFPLELESIERAQDLIVNFNETTSWLAVDNLIIETSEGLYRLNLSHHASRCLF